MRALLVLALAGAATLAPAVASAETAEELDLVVWDEDEPPPLYVPELRASPRLVLGFDFGIGGFDGTCGGCLFVGGLSLDVFAGAQLTPRLAVLADVWAVLHPLATDGDQSGLATHALAVAAARTWIVPTVWAQAGAGIGILGFAGRVDNRVFSGPGAMTAIGIEMDHGPCRGIDLQFRAGGTLVPDADSRALIYSVAAVVGFHWN